MINPWSPNTYFLLLPTPQRRSIYLFFLYFLTFSRYSIPDTKNTKRYPCNAQSGALHTSPASVFPSRPAWGGAAAASRPGLLKAGSRAPGSPCCVRQWQGKQGQELESRRSSTVTPDRLCWWESYLALQAYFSSSVLRASE